MKKALAWILRLCCFAVIIAALVTVARCIMHINDDHSYAAVMGVPAPTAAESISTAEPEPVQSAEPAETPVVTLTADGGATLSDPNVELTAAFSGIQNSVQADLKWYLDGVLVSEDKDKLLVNGATVDYTAEIDVANAEADDAVVELMVEYGDGLTVSAGTIFPVERPEETTVVIRTEEITVTCLRDCSIYRDSALEDDTGKTLEAGETGLLLGYEAGALQLQFADGTDGWVSADRNEITDEDCTTDQDYTDEQKTDFVNSMGYESRTDDLVWVNLYTQKVNVFHGESGSWALQEVFDCASGVNETPTTTGVFAITSMQERWDLGGSYVSPVLIFNGGEAFTSQPKDSDSDEILDDTIGKPASGGSVRLLDDDIVWMAENLAVGTTVIVY